ncbi:hypothetical protein WN944_026936 [Citrus x changshan-huyou]|uniref:EXPERA domain-containing protein n=1 Tax=Citrus x changshan-huyou TaxID=2935761 RepID=A0AAP0Q7R1_9ROSI
MSIKSLFSNKFVSTAGRSSRKLSKTDRWLMIWWAVSGLIHIIHEGYWFFSPEFYKDKSGNYFAEVWKEYSKGDSRYASRHVAVLAIEGIAVIFVGPASLLAMYAIAKGKSYSYILQFALSLVQFYGSSLYFITAFLEGNKEPSKGDEKVAFALIKDLQRNPSGFNVLAARQGATRHMTTQKKSMMEIESVGAAGKYDIGHVKKYFRVGKIFALFLCGFVAPIVAIHVVCHVPRNVPATFALKRSLVKTMANACDLHTCTMHALVSSLGIIVQRYYQFGFCCCIKILAVVLADFDFWCKYFAAGEIVVYFGIDVI